MIFIEDGSRGVYSSSYARWSFFRMLRKAILYDTYSFPSEPHREFCHPVDQLMDRDLTIARTILTFFLPLFIIFVAYAGMIQPIYRISELWDLRFIGSPNHNNLKI